MEAKDFITLGISLLALILSGLSLYVSVRREGQKTQLSLIVRKHEVVRLLQTIEESIKIGKEALPVIANLMTNEQRKTHETALKKVFDNFKEMADET